MNTKSAQGVFDAKKLLVWLVWLSIAAIFLLVFFFQRANEARNVRSANFPGDCDGDGFVDLFDYGYLSRSFGLTQGQPEFDARCDFHVDQFNIIDLFDYQILANNFGRTGPTSTPGPTNPIPTSPPTNYIPAFPGAEGFGAQTRGGRGGRVIEVTNTNDSGAGSFRECATASGARTCVFKVSGIITINSDIIISNPNLTVAGQTAPSGGITFKASNPNSTTGIYVKAPEVIIRYIRSRPGTTVMNSRALSVNNGSSNQATAVRNVMIDHNSFSWAGDELTITWLATNNLSYQWNIASETLSPWKGPSFGEDGGGYFSVHHNLIAHNSQRNPQVTGNVGTIDVVNNLVYNPGGIGSVAKNGTHVNYVKNYIKAGPNSTLNHYVDDTGSGAKGPAEAVYFEGNVLEGIQNLINSNTHVVSTRLSAPPITTTTAQVAYDQVLGNAGAHSGLDCNGGWFTRRDSVDTRIIQSVRDRTRGHGGTGYITSPSQVGGWPVPVPGNNPCPDSDHDGMSDTWENRFFGNTLRGSSTNSNQDMDGDGYTDLEEYLNATNPTVRDR